MREPKSLQSTAGPPASISARQPEAHRTSPSYSPPGPGTNVAHRIPEHVYAAALASPPGRNATAPASRQPERIQSPPQRLQQTVGELCPSCRTAFLLMSVGVAYCLAKPWCPLCFLRTVTAPPLGAFAEDTWFRPSHTNHQNGALPVSRHDEGLAYPLLQRSRELQHNIGGCPGLYRQHPDACPPRLWIAPSFVYFRYDWRIAL